MFVTYAGGPPEPEQLGYGRRDISEIANRLAEIFRIVLRAGYPAWNESSEALITALERLLAQKERLQEAYMLLFKDLETARQRIHTLELQYESLLDQRSRTPEGWRSPKVILGIAGIVATLIAPVITVASEHAFSASANRVLEQAMTVERDCNKTIINNYTVTAPTDAATGSVSPAAGQLGRTQLGTTPLGGAPGATSPPAASGIGSAPYGTQPYGGY